MASTTRIFAVLLSVSVVTIVGMYLFSGDAIQPLMNLQLSSGAKQRKAPPAASAPFVPMSGMESLLKQKQEKIPFQQPKVGGKCPFRFELTARNTEERYHKIGKDGFMHTAYYDGRIGGGRLFAVGFPDEGPLQCIVWFDETDCIMGNASSSLVR